VRMTCISSSQYDGHEDGADVCRTRTRPDDDGKEGVLERVDSAFDSNDKVILSYTWFTVPKSPSETTRPEGYRPSWVYAL